VRRAIQGLVVVLASVFSLSVAAPSAFAGVPTVSASSSCTSLPGTVAPNSELGCQLTVTNSGGGSQAVLIGFAYYEFGSIEDGGHYSILLKPGATSTDNLSNMIFQGGPPHGASFIASVGLSSYGDVYRQDYKYTVRRGPVGTPGPGGASSSSCTPSSGTMPPNSSLNCSLTTTNNDGYQRLTYYVGFAHYEFGTIVDGGYYSIQLSPYATYNPTLSTTFDGGKHHGAAFQASAGYYSSKVVKDRYRYTVLAG
jgi:hypothetical protein